MAPAAAQGTYPAKAVKIIVPAAPGGTADIMARLLATHLQSRFGSNVVAENRSGAGGNVGAEAVARADGQPMALAGLWEGWRGPEGEVLRTFTVLTTAGSFVAGPATTRLHRPTLHHRTAVLLEALHQVRALHARAFTTPRPWSEAEFTALLTDPLAFLLVEGDAGGVGGRGHGGPGRPTTSRRGDRPPDVRPRARARR